MPPASSPSLPYRLGLPAWAFAGWRGTYLPPAPTALAAYLQQFNAVEGNTSFYRVPDARSVASWREAAAGTDFAFAFKLPRSVTHERAPDWRELAAFYAALEPLGDALGPFMLQLPARVGPEDLGWLGRLAAQLSTDHRYVVEVRHPAFFDQADRLAPLLERFGFGRVVLDARALYEGDRSHPEVVNALHEKPDLPVAPRVANGISFVRLVLHPDRRDNQRYIDEWARDTARRLADGVETWVTIHCPNNQHCPELAREFHDALRAIAATSLPALPPWPGPVQARLL